MNGEDRSELSVLRAEVNGKLDLLLERASHLKTCVDDHESRLRKREQVDVHHLAKTVESIKARVSWTAGGLAAIIFAINFAFQKGWL